MKTKSINLLTVVLISLSFNLKAATYKEAGGKSRDRSRTPDSAPQLRGPRLSLGADGRPRHPACSSYYPGVTSRVLPGGAGPPGLLGGVGVEAGVSDKGHGDSPGYYQL
jgi:hypothetical protein